MDELDDQKQKSILDALQAMHDTQISNETDISSLPAGPAEDPRLTEALDRQNKLQMYSNLLRGFQKIVQAPATAQGFKADYAGSDALMKAATQPVKQYKLKLDQEKAAKKEQREQEKNALELDAFQTKLAKSKIDLTNDQDNQNPKSQNSLLAQERLMELREKELGRPLSDSEKSSISQRNAMQIYQYLPQLREDIYKAMSFQQKEKELASEEKRSADRLAAEQERNKKLDAMEERRVKAQASREEQQDRQYKQQQINTARGLIKDDPRFKKAMEQSMEFDSVNELISEAEKGNQQAVGALGTKLARAMGEVGALTESDVTRYVAGQSWGRKLKDWYTKGAKGELSPETIKGITSNLKNLKSKLDNDVNKVYDKASGRMKTAYPDMDDETIRGLLGAPVRSVASEMVRMKDPKGVVRMIPKDQVEAAKKAGGEVIN